MMVSKISKSKLSKENKLSKSSIEETQIDPLYKKLINLNPIQELSRS